MSTTTASAPRRPGMGTILMGMFIVLVAVPFAVFVSVNYPSDWASIYPLVPAGIGGGAIIVGILQNAGRLHFGPIVENRPAQERLTELEKLKSGGLITAEEYAAKRQEILKTV